MTPILSSDSIAKMTSSLGWLFLVTPILSSDSKITSLLTALPSGSPSSNVPSVLRFHFLHFIWNLYFELFLKVDNCEGDEASNENLAVR